MRVLSVELLGYGILQAGGPVWADGARDGKRRLVQGAREGVDGVRRGWREPAGDACVLSERPIASEGGLSSPCWSLRENSAGGMSVEMKGGTKAHCSGVQAAQMS